MRALRERYGAGPLHLLALLASFALAGAAAWSLIADRPVAVIVWFVGAAVVHDLVLLPLYALLDRALVRRGTGGRDAAAPAGWVNYVRVPAGIALILLLVFLPSIARLSDVYTRTTGLSASGYLVRWLLVTGALFVVSGVVFVVRRASSTHGG